MSLLSRAKLYMKSRFSRKDPRFTVDIRKQLKFMNDLPTPKDGIDRSYNQYLCQRMVDGKTLFFFLNIASLLLMPIYLIKSFFWSLNNEKHYDSVAFLNDISHDIIPTSLSQNSGEIKYLNTEQSYYLDGSDKKFIYTIWKKHPISFYFLFKIMMKVSMYSYAIQKYNPKNVIAYVEYSFTSSALTEYCRMRGVLHINVLHGEKPLYIRDSFVLFDRFYVWDKFYESQFIKLRAADGQFVIELPPAFKLQLKNTEVSEKTYDFIYYLGNESKPTQIKICNALDQLVNKGYRVAIRPHPRYSNLESIKSISKNIHIEDSKSTDIASSILSTNYAVALFSTVLNQSHYNNVKVVIDDISDPNRFNVLKSLNYIGFTFNYSLLSEWVKS